MYYEFVKRSISCNKAVDLLYLGIKYTILSNEQGILLCNCYSGIKTVYQHFDDLLQNCVIRNALISTDRNNIWVGLVEHRCYAQKEEFLEQVRLGGEIQFIYKGVGYFLTSIFEGEKRSWFIQNLHDQTKHKFRDTKELLSICLDEHTLDCCWDNIEIITYY